MALNSALRPRDLLPIQVKTLAHLNLDFPEITDDLSGGIQARFATRKDEKLLAQFLSHEDRNRWNTLHALDLEIPNSKIFTEDFFDQLSLNYLHMRPNELKFLIKHDSDLLLGSDAWAGNIMAELYYEIAGSEESIYFVLNVIKKVEYCLYLPLKEINRYLYAFLQLVMDNSSKCRDFYRLVFDIVKIFVVRNDLYRHFISNCPIDLEAILWTAVWEKQQIWDLWTDTYLFGSEATNVCLHRNLKNFSLFLKYGGTNSFSFESFDGVAAYFLQEIGFIMEDAHLRILMQFLQNETFKFTKFRLLQVICLYLRRFNPDAVDALKWLWSSIKDPYLSEKDILLLQYYVLNGEVKEELSRCWTWYCKHVSNNVVKQPRSLKHLSRCAVRSRLARCLNLPIGIGNLDLPNELIQYLAHVNNNID